MSYYLLSDLIYQRAAELKEKEVIRSRNKKTGKWEGISWNTFASKVQKLAEVLVEYGVKEQHRIGVYSQNMEECLTVDYACFSTRLISVPMYATSSIKQIEYIIEESEIDLLFVGEQFQYDNAYDVLKQSKTLKQIVVFDQDVVLDPTDTSTIFFNDFTARPTQSAKEVESRRKRAKESDIAHLVYTSGTTGEPKGVILTFGNYYYAMIIHDKRLSYMPKDGVSMSFLPLTHIFEKAWSIYCLHKGWVVAINLDPKEIQSTIKEVRPEAMCSVPRFWEKVYAGVQEKINSSSAFRKALFIDAIRTGKKYVFEYRNRGIKAPWLLSLKFKLYNKTIFTILKKVIGIEKGIIYPCAGAPLSDNINTFIQSVNIPLVYGYGLTETTASVSCFLQSGFTIGTVGAVMPDVEVKIGDNDEILVKGETIMRGYYKKEAATQACFTEDGWFRTGDAGALTNKNEIIITERIKDLYKTSNGKYIAPQQIEMRLCEDKFIESVAIIADNRKYVSALIVPDFAELTAYANSHGISFSSNEELCNNTLIHNLYLARIEPLQQELANFEQIKKFTILSKPFTMDTGELTNTLKLKRAVILEKFSKEIEAMYS